MVVLAKKVIFGVFGFLIFDFYDPETEQAVCYSISLHTSESYNVARALRNEYLKNKKHRKTKKPKTHLYEPWFLPALIIMR
jgi:hypothetical protein